MSSLNLDWVAAIIGILTALNLWLNMSIQNKLLKLELRLKEDMISKEDFRNWTKQSSQLPTFREPYSFERAKANHGNR